MNSSQTLYQAVLWNGDQRITELDLSGGKYLAEFRSRVSRGKFLFASQLRANQTRTESMLWARLRGRQVLGTKFRRQSNVLGWIVDFYCPELRLVIEIDGSSHDNRQEQDRHRDNVMLMGGFSVIRVRVDYLGKNLEQVIQGISEAIRYCRSK